MIKSLSLLLALCLSTSAAIAEQKLVEYKDKVNQRTYKVKYDCDFSVPRAYTCLKQEILFPEGGSYVSSSVPKEKDGSYKFWIAGLGYVATVNQDIYTMVKYLDTSGSPSMAEERFELLDFNNKSKFGLMTYPQLQAKLKKIKSQMKVDFAGGIE